MDHLLLGTIPRSRHGAFTVQIEMSRQSAVISGQLSFR